MELFTTYINLYAIENEEIKEMPIEVKITRNYLQFYSSYDKITPLTRANHFDYIPAIDGKFLNRFNAKITVVIEDYNNTILKTNFRGRSDYQFYCNLNRWQILLIKTITRKYTVLNINIKTVFWEYVVVVIGSYFTVTGLDKLIIKLKVILKALSE